jgi:cell wall-associated NlpC family hydrolase
VALGLVAAGGLLAYSGVKDVAIPDAIRAVVTTGTLPAGTPAAPAASGSALWTPGGGSSGSAVADAALKYQGVPYKWAGATPSGWDCSGFVTWVLHHDLGYNLPSNSHTVCTQFLIWSGAAAVRPPMQVQAGDLVVWPTHMGIAVSATQMISAENPRRGTRVDTFQGGGPIPYTPPVFLRLKSATLEGVLSGGA